METGASEKTVPLEMDLQELVRVITKIVSSNNVKMTEVSRDLHNVADILSRGENLDKTMVLELCRQISDQNFITKICIPLLQNEENLGECHDLNCLLKDFVVIYERVSLNIPTSMATVQNMGFIELLRNEMTIANTLVDQAETLNRIFQIKKRILDTLVQKSQDKPRIDNKEDNLRPPENFRELSILPTDEDLVYPIQFLRKNKKSGEYKDLDHYLDVQFRLYREDCIAPLREAYEEFIIKDHKINHRSFRLESGRMYRNVWIESQTSTSVEHGEVYNVCLDPDHLSRIRWVNSKRLIYGSLLILSFDRFQSIMFAIVAESDKETRQRGIVTVKIIRTNPKQKIPKGIMGIIIETTSAYFEAYYHVLSALQSIQEEHFLFQKYIVFCQKEIDMPKYLLVNEEVSYDLTPIVHGSRIKVDSRRQDGEGVVTINKSCTLSTTWPSGEELRMDDSQKRAFTSALLNEFVLIQGPPGTGKTYLGLQIAKALLHNIKQGNETEKQCSLLVVCYTNHALDQFLEGIIDFVPIDVSREFLVRIGNQCKNPKLENYVIKNHRKNIDTRHGYYDVMTKAERTKRAILINRKIIDVLKTQRLVLNFEIMKYVIPEEYHEDLYLDSDVNWYHWLGVLPEMWLQTAKEKAKKSRNKYPRRPPTIMEGQNQDQQEEDLENEDMINERTVDGDQHVQLNVSVIGKDIVEQLNTLTNDTKKQYLKYFLIDEGNRFIQELQSKTVTEIDFIQDSTNIWDLSYENRWKLYRYWQKLYEKDLLLKIKEKGQQFNAIFEEYKKARLEVDEQILRNATVIGMTTTCAARYNELLKRVSPKITIIEEAAEVPEAHIVSAINPGCEHLVLIGDHKQLEPKTAVRELAVRYNLSISLFERMIENGMEYHCLAEQHRMRPEIADLVRHIYPVLNDHIDVTKYENVKGITKNLFFIDHRQAEKRNEELKSYSNEHEAKYVVALYSYLIKQGYKNTDITILTPYAGQVLCIKEKLLAEKFWNVKLCVLDNYQGEENEIIILSLVRSNDQGDIGFLSKENRICVALSRAKIGLYIIGDSNTLCNKCKSWQYIIKMLQSKDNTSETNIGDCFGKALPLVCQNHNKEAGIMAEKVDDFTKAPDGGCNKLCEERLDCGHACKLHCHPVDRNHEAYICTKVCNKRCPDDHLCQKECHFPELCYCPVIVNRKLPCDHFAEMQCYNDPKNIACKTKVKEIRDCGHDLVSKCCDLCYNRKKSCRVDVIKTFEDCGHEKTVPCSSALKTASEFESNRFGPFTCYRAADTSLFCTEMIDKMLDCGHTKTVQCCSQLMTTKCDNKCEKVCSQGHICKEICHYDTMCRCTETVQLTLEECGHEISVLCDTKTKYLSGSRDLCRCKETVQLILDSCGHKINVECNTKTKYLSGLEKICKCTEIVELILEDCGHEIFVPCNEKTKYLSESKEVRSRISISRMYNCKTNVRVQYKNCDHFYEIECWKNSRFPDGRSEKLYKIICKEEVKVESELCGHEIKLPCFLTAKDSEERISVVKSLLLLETNNRLMLDDKENVLKDRYKCTIIQRAQLSQHCKHSIDIECWKQKLLMKGTPEEMLGIKCEKEVDFILDCGHTIQLPCFRAVKALATNDPNIRKQLIGEAHRCRILVSYTFPKCKHHIMVECWNQKLLLEGHTGINIRMKCRKEVSCELDVCGPTTEITWVKAIQIATCNDPTTRKCLVDEISYCQKLVTYTFPECGHDALIECHQAQEMEFSESSLLKCRYKLSDVQLLCGHKREIICSDPNKNKCIERCQFRMLCGHKCSGKCHECNTKMAHESCDSLCIRNLVCGHECQAFQCYNYRPCCEPCSFFCNHNKCNKNCNEPCEPCRKRCDWICPHATCSNLCYEVCNREPCLEQCPVQLACGHNCRGFCGEPCSPCVICTPEKIVGLSDSYQQNVIMLLDCNHAFESSILDRHIQETSENLLIRCPECKTIVRAHPRYNATLKVKKMLMENAKEQIRAIRVCKEQSFPCINIQNLSACTKYTGIFLQFLELIRYKYEGKSTIWDLDQLKQYSENLTRAINDYEHLHLPSRCLSIYQQIYKLHCYWMLLYVTSNENLVNKQFRVKIKLENGSLSDDKEDDFMNLSLNQFAEYIIELMVRERRDEIEEHFSVLYGVMRNEIYIDEAIKVPQITRAYGVHEGDWKACPNGHLMPCVISSSSCDVCIGAYNIDQAIHLETQEQLILSVRKQSTNDTNKNQETLSSISEDQMTPDINAAKEKICNEKHAATRLKKDIAKGQQKRDKTKLLTDLKKESFPAVPSSLRVDGPNDFLQHHFAKSSTNPQSFECWAERRRKTNDNLPPEQRMDSTRPSFDKRNTKGEQCAWSRENRNTTTFDGTQTKDAFQRGSSRVIGDYTKQGDKPDRRRQNDASTETHPEQYRAGNLETKGHWYQRRGTERSDQQTYRRNDKNSSKNKDESQDGRHTGHAKANESQDRQSSGSKRKTRWKRVL